MLLVVALLIQGVCFFCFFTENEDSGTHPNIFLEMNAQFGANLSNLMLANHLYDIEK